MYGYKVDEVLCHSWGKASRPTPSGGTFKPPRAVQSSYSPVQAHTKSRAPSHSFWVLLPPYELVRRPSVGI